MRRHRRSVIKDIIEQTLDKQSMSYISHNRVWNAVLYPISHQGLARPSHLEEVRMSPVCIWSLYLPVNKQLLRNPILDHSPPVDRRAKKCQPVFDQCPGLHFYWRRRQDAET